MRDEGLVYRLTGWIRLMPEDGFGIPLFSAGKNEIYIPETDNQLLIVQFHTFYNDEGYQIDYALPAGHKNQPYVIGEGAPIPFSVGGRLGVADTSAGCEALLKAYGAKLDQGIVGTIARVILQAETGVFERESLDRRTRIFESRHGTVFLEEPVHSLYWIEQYEHAAKQHKLISSTERDAFWEKLKLLASEWLGRYFKSGKLQLLMQFVGICQSYQIISREEGRITYYIVFSHLICKKNLRDVLLPTAINTIRNRIPEGLYYYQIVDSYLGHSSKTTSSIQRDLLSIMGYLLDSAEERKDFKTAMAVSNILFGNRELPPDIYSKALLIASRFVEVIERGANSYYGQPPKKLKGSLLSAYRALQSIRQFLDWEGRPVTGPAGLGLSKEAVWLLDQWLEAGEVA